MSLALKLPAEKEGSTFAVRVERIRSIEAHPQADRLDIATVLGWQTVVPKGQYVVGQLVVYIPIDSILPPEVESKLFGADSKIKLSKSRVKTIKLRGAISQGMVTSLSTFGITKAKEGMDLTETLKITKYEPPAPKFNGTAGVANRPAYNNPNFHKYGGIENFKNYPDLFKEGELVHITEKIHGSHFRAGYVKSEANTLWKKIKKLFGKLPEYEFVYGSNNQQLQDKWLYAGFYDKNIYADAVVAYKLKEVLKPGEVVHGEVYGDGIQKGYTYGCKTGERKLILFDLKVEGNYVDTSTFAKFCSERSLPRVPVLFIGPFGRETAKKLTVGTSVLEPSQKVREGVVIKPLVEEKTFMGRKLLKLISDEYLLGDNTEFH